MAKYTVEADRFGVKHHRPTSLEGYVEYDLQHYSPNWTEEYKIWLARQAMRVFGLVFKIHE